MAGSSGAPHNTVPRHSGNHTHAHPKVFLRLAAKNLTRYRRRTTITASAIAFGVAVFIAMASLLGGMVAEGDRNFSNYETGSAAVTAAGYWDEREQFPLDMLVEDGAALTEALETEGFAAAPRVAFRGELIVHYDPYPEDGSAHLGMYGIDPARDPEVFNLAESVTEGRFLEQDEHGILISAWLAERLGAEVGYPVTITTRTRDGFHQIMDLDIVGIYETPNPTVDRSSIFMPLETAEYYLELAGAVTAVHLRLPEQVPGAADLAPVRSALESAGFLNAEELELLGFNEMTADFAAAVELQDAVFRVILFLLATIAVVGISNTMLMAVLEREREIGMMRALGVRDREIGVMFMFEAAGIGLLGGIIGMLFGTAAVWYLTQHGIDYSAMLEGIEMDLRFDGVLYGVWSLGTTVSAAVGAAVLAGVVALLPVRRILRRTITESLRTH